MLVFLNGRFVPEEQATVSVFDRGFLYGDGLFESVLIRNGKPFRWGEHLHRLQSGAAFLGIQLPFPPEKIIAAASELISRNQLADALLRLTLSRGVGVRGYSPKGADKPTLVMSLHPWKNSAGAEETPRWKLITASARLPANEPLALFKTCNKLPQILARAEADATGADEALLLNSNGFVVEASTSNLFWMEGEVVCTAPLASGILAGVTRSIVGEICRSLEMPVRETNVTVAELKERRGIFLSLSSWGVVEAQSLDGAPVEPSPAIQKIRSEYWRRVNAETAGSES